jgi:orotate phosphoribosyltransferase
MTAPTMTKGSEAAIQALVRAHQELYEGPDIDAALERIIRETPYSKLSSWDIHRILRTSRSVLFDVHVDVASGHHTATYLRFESIARIPPLLTLIARDMADWICQTFRHNPLDGIVTTASAAQLLAERVADMARDRMRLRVALTPFDHDTGRIGADLVVGAVGPGERFVALNDVSARGACVGKLGAVVTDRGGALAGLMMFARRDSGQFPLMNELAAKGPFYATADLEMPQWSPAECPRCKTHFPLLSWKDMPEF